MSVTHATLARRIFRRSVREAYPSMPGTAAFRGRTYLDKLDPRLAPIRYEVRHAEGGQVFAVAHPARDERWDGPPHFAAALLGVHELRELRHAVALRDAREVCCYERRQGVFVLFGSQETCPML